MPPYTEACRWQDLECRKKLAASFHYVADWAGTDNIQFLKDDDRLAIQRAASIMESSVAHSSSIATALRYAAGVRHELQMIVDLEKTLHHLPKNNPHRTNPQLRMALRRAQQFLSEEGATFQYC